MENYKFEKEQFVGKIHKDYVNQFSKLPIIYRLTGDSHRIYFTKEAHGVTVLNSGTTLIDNYKDESGIIALEKWRNGLVSQGINPSDYLKERQDYGTILHLIYGEILMGKQLTFDSLHLFIKERAMTELGYTEEEALRYFIKHKEELFKDISSFVKWVDDYKIEPIAVEQMMRSEKYRVATAIDLVCYATVEEKGFWGEVYKSGAKKGEPKETKQAVRKLIIVDFKSGKSKGFYPVNILQLLLNRVIFEENLPDIKLDGVYNFAPNDWRTSPSYEFYDQERESKMTDFLDKIKHNVFERGKEIFEEKLQSRRELAITGDVLNPEIEFLSLEEVALGYFSENVEENEQES